MNKNLDEVAKQIQEDSSKSSMEIADVAIEILKPILEENARSFLFNIGEEVMVKHETDNRGNVLSRKDLVEGVYDGEWSGYRIEFRYGSRRCHIETAEEIRGFTKVKIHVRGGAIRIERLSPSNSE